MKKFLKWLAAGFIVLGTGLLAAGCGDEAKGAESAGGGKGGSELAIHVLDIGQGDATLLSKDGKWVLIDSGDVEHRPQMKEYLKKYGVSELSKVIVTHPHADHMGGMLAVFQSVSIKDIYDDGVATSTNTYRTYLKNIKAKNVNYHKTKSGDDIALFDGVNFHVLAPVKILKDNKGEDDLNNNSICGRLSYGNFSMIFTGDAEEVEEKTILETGATVKSDVMKVGHHGSRTSSSTAFVKAVSPKVGIISVGAGNSYGHPHSKTLKTLEKYNVQIMRTDRDGTVTVKSTGSGDFTITKAR